MSLVAFERGARNILARFIGRLFPTRPLTAEDIRHQLKTTPHSKILFVRQHQRLGDMLLATSVFRAMQESYPAAELHVLADAYNEKALRGNTRIHRVWIWENKRMLNPLNVLAALRAFRAEKFTLAIPLFSHIPSFTSFLIARLCGAHMVAAYDTRPFYGGAPWSKYLANLKIPVLPDAASECERFMGQVKPLLNPSAKDDLAPEFETSPESDAWAAAEWERVAHGDTRKRIGIFLGGNPARPERLWPARHWAALAQKLQQHPDVFLAAIVPAMAPTGGRTVEQGIYEQVAPSLKPGTPALAHPDLKHQAALLKKLDLFVCVDGGIFHVAVASKVRTLGLFFGTEPARWMPPVPWASALVPQDEKPESLTPETVYQKIEEMVLKSKAAARS